MVVEELNKKRYRVDDLKQTLRNALDCRITRISIINLQLIPIV
ncbi:MAG: hypothetical protein LEGION0403_FIIPPAGN_02426 [Legionella sp.]